MGSHPLDFFEAIHVINLPARRDRRKELTEELGRIKYPESKIKWFSAIRPDDPAPFRSIGEKGCFLSHLNILRIAESNGYGNVLILEDDVSFVDGFSDQLSSIVEHLKTCSWDVFYGGGFMDKSTQLDLNLAVMSPEDGIGGTHCVAFNGATIGRVRRYLEAQTTRPNGDPAGGPMAVDGSYCWARRELRLDTFIASPQLAIQRPSRSDITPRFWDKLYGVNKALGAIRKLKERKRKEVRAGETSGRGPALPRS